MITDAVNTVKSILEDNWTSTNTDGITPRFYENWNVRRIMSLHPIPDAITIYKLPSTQTTNCLGKSTREVREPVTIDVITTKQSGAGGGRAHLIKLMKEVDRIISGKIINPDSNYDILDPDGTTWRDWGDTYKGIFRWTYDVILIKTNETRPT